VVTRDAPAVSVSPGRVNLPVRRTGPAEQKLDALHRLTVNAAVTFTAGVGESPTKTTVVQLVKKPSSSHARLMSLTHLRVSPAWRHLPERGSADAASRPHIAGGSSTSDRSIEGWPQPQRVLLQQSDHPITAALASAWPRTQLS
jgi:hypothetical protein